MRKAPRAGSGHNLLEMIIATFIFSTVLLGLTSVWMQHSRVMERAGGRLVGQFLANQLMEECIAAGYDLVSNLATNPASPPEPLELSETMRGIKKDVEYRPTITVVDTPVPGSPNARMKLVTVRVEWDEHNGTGWIDYTSQLTESGGAPAASGPP